MFIIPYKRLVLYADKEVTDFIQDFFKIRKGLRCRVRHNNRKTPFYWEDYNDGKSMRFNLVTIDESNIYPELKYGTSHFYQHIFDKDVLTKPDEEVEILLKRYNISRTDIPKRKPFVKQVIESHYAGMTIVIDIDSPQINEETTDRTNFFDDKVIEYFNEATRLFAREFDDFGIRYNCEFSGNGFYFILESYYPDEHGKDIRSYQYTIQEICRDVDNWLEEKNIPIRIKQKIEGWNRYNKHPFTFHDRLNRISIPLGKEHIGNIDVRWLKEVTDVSKLIDLRKDYINNDILHEIIKRCKWEKIW